MKAGIPGLAQTRRNGIGTGGKTGVVGVDRLQTQCRSAARARIGERTDISVHLDRFDHDRSGAIDTAVDAVHRHLIACAATRTGRTQQYFATRAVFSAAHIHRAAGCQIQPALGGADFHFPAVFTATRRISVQFRASQHRHVVLCIKMDTARILTRGVDMAGDVEFAVIHRDTDFVCLDRIGRGQADIAGAHPQGSAAIEYALVKCRVKRGEIRQRGHIEVETPALASGAVGIRRSRALQTTRGQSHRAIGRADGHSTRIAARRRGDVHLRAGLHHHVAIVAGQFDGAAGGGACDIEEGHRSPRGIRYRIRAQFKIAGGRDQLEPSRRQVRLGIEHQRC
ncbi:MAG: hypothetical protein L0H19_02160, partial [Salinisphaera sp.]|nr:hypothetical protein [Salinisphaera sp.]